VAVVGNGLKCSHNRCQDKGYADGFRTIVDLVAEVRGCKPIEAVRELGERFGFEVPKPKTAANQNQVGEVDSGSVPDSFYDSLYGVDADDKSPVKKPVNENGNQAGTKQENGPEPKPVEDPMKAWVTVMTVADLFEPEPKANLVIPALGIAPGPPHGWVGEGYVGKTITALSMGLCVAAGLPVWNLYPVVKGRWLHIDHEQGRRVTKKRIIRLMLGMGIATDMIVTSFGFAVYPKLNLTTKNAEDLYCRLLDGWQMATFDALKGLTPGVDENSSEIRDYMAKLSRASEKTGCSVVLIHHGGKPDAKAPKARKNMGRGSSGIFDECQSYFVATANKGEPVIVSHEKTRELDTPVDNFELRIEDVTINEREGAGLRVVHDTAEPGDEPAVNASLAQVCERVVQAVMCAPGASSRELALTVRAKKETLYAALDQLARKGRIVNTGTRASASWRAK